MAMSWAVLDEAAARQKKETIMVNLSSVSDSGHVAEGDYHGT
jgi:hypothetical protein